MFALSRYNSSDVIIKKLTNILLDTNSIKSQNAEIIDSLDLLKLESIQFALMNFQRLKYFPADWKFRNTILKMMMRFFISN